MKKKRISSSNSTPPPPRKDFPFKAALGFLFLYVAGIILTLTIVRKPSSIEIDEAPSTPRRETERKSTRNPVTPHQCDLDFDHAVNLMDNGHLFDDFSISIHRNGEAEACGASVANVDILNSFRRSSHAFSYSPLIFDQYDIDSLLTHAFATSILSSEHCGPSAKKKFTPPACSAGSNDNSLSKIGEKESDFLEFCDMGEVMVPILPDHSKIIPVHLIKGKISLPCHFHTREGVRVTSLQQLVHLVRDAREQFTSGNQNSKNHRGHYSANKTELHLYAVPAGRHFMFAPSHVGEIFDLHHVSSPFGRNLNVSLEVLSVSPRVFEVKNFLSVKEANNVVKNIAEDSWKRSTTGTHNDVDNKCTSETSFDISSKTSNRLKRRSFDVLGVDYDESFADGLQVVRFNKTTAYVPHLDWIHDKSNTETHDYNSMGVGTNRFAAFKFYMNDVPETAGGRTVFTRAWPRKMGKHQRVPMQKVIGQIRKSNLTDLFKEGSWEETMLAECSTKLTVIPKVGRALMFYTQHSNGEPDHFSFSGDCPIVWGQKWDANMWIWNGPRNGFPGSPINKAVVETKDQNGYHGNSFPVEENTKNSVSVMFKNSGDDLRYVKAELYFAEDFWETLRHGDPSITVSTMKGLTWNVRVDGEVVISWVIQFDKQVFML